MPSVSPNREKEIYRVTWIGSIVNFLLLVLKFAAGIVGNSAAMVADAIHSLSDFVTDIIVVVFVRISGKPEDEGHDYGHGKYETLATTIISLILFFVGIGILVSGCMSVVAVVGGEVLEAPTMFAFVMAAVSIVSKEILYRYTAMKGKRLNSQAVIANAWHHRSDAFSSIGTLIGIGGAIFLGESWRVLDPIAAIVVSIFIMRVALQLFKPCIDELLERSLPKEVEDRILSIVASFPEVSAPHHLRTRRIGSQLAIELHIRMDGNLSLTESHATTTSIEKALKSEFGADTHIGIHTEPIK